MKQTDVFYVNLKKLISDKPEPIISENGNSTELGSQKVVKDKEDTCSKPVSLKRLNLADQKPFKIFQLFYYKIVLHYSHRTFYDHFLMEKDFLCNNFFELYLKDVLTAELNNEDVTHFESQSKLNRSEVQYNPSVLQTV
jgi:hypothetical protein